LAISAQGADLQEALKTVYRNLSLITFNNSYWRPDIGLDMIKNQKG
jgi:phosphoribosylamine-glycine ligase